MKRDWLLSHGRDGWSLRLVEEPEWAVLAETVWDKLCDLTQGWLGGHGVPEWVWSVPVGKPDWDFGDPEDPWLKNNVASALYDLETRVLHLTDTFGRTVATIPIDRDTAYKILPEFVAEVEEMMAEAGDE